MTSYLALVLDEALVGDADISRTAALAFLCPCSQILERKNWYGVDHAATISPLLQAIDIQQG